MPDSVKPSLADQAYVALRDLLVTLQIQPGAPIGEEQLMRQLGVGRTPLRDAIRRLESQRLVAVYPRRGTFATEINITDLGLIFDVRLQLEGHAAQRAAEHATDADRQRLRGLLAELDGAGKDVDALMQLDGEIHRAIYACAHNGYLAETLEEYHTLALRLWYLFVDRLPDVWHHIAEHEELLNAIVDGDGERARQAARAHVAGFEQAIRALLDRR